MRMINIHRFCVTLLSLLTLSTPVRGQDYYYDTDGEATTAAEGSGTTTTAEGTTVTEFQDYTDTTAAIDPPAPTAGGGGGGGTGGGAGGVGGGVGGGSSDISKCCYKPAQLYTEEFLFQFLLRSYSCSH